MSADPQRAFEEIVGELDYPMLIVTAAAGDDVGGCLVGFATQTSIDPPRFLVCLSENNRTYRIAREAQALGVHFLTTDDDDLAELFGGQTGDEVDKFGRVEWRRGSEGTPLIERCRNRFVGRVLDRRPAGDHVAFLLEPVAVGRDENAQPFRFHRAKRIEPGHEA